MFMLFTKLDLSGFAMIELNIQITFPVDKQQHSYFLHSLAISSL